MPQRLINLRLIVLGLLMLSVVGCTRHYSSELARQCSESLDVAHTELENAKVKGFSGSLSWSKAASLLAAASVQRQFEKYTSCIDKVSRARLYIQESQR